MDSLSTYKQNEITIASEHSSIQPSGDGSVIIATLNKTLKYDLQNSLRMEFPWPINTSILSISSM